MNEQDNRYDPEEDLPVDGYYGGDLNDLGRYELTPEEREYEERIRQRMRERRRIAEQRRVKRNRTIALTLLLIIVSILCKSCYTSYRKKHPRPLKPKKTESAAAADTDLSRPEQAESQPEGETTPSGHKIQQVEGMTFIDGILIVNKTYSLPKDYAPGIDPAAQKAFDEMTGAAFNDGLYLYVNSGYRSYDEQYSLYKNYASERGVAEADRVSSRPGYSEHQSGLCFDVNSTEFSFSNTKEARWLAAHCADYGFIIRFPKGKEAITGYEYESWHIRYVGVDVAKDITAKGMCLEEYLGVTSDYNNAPDGLSQESMAEQLGVTVYDPNGNDNDTESGYGYDLPSPDISKPTGQFADMAQNEADTSSAAEYGTQQDSFGQSYDQGYDYGYAY